MSFNRITIVGNLGNDPEVKLTTQGVNVCSVSVATTEKGKGGQPDVTTWFRVTFWRQQAEMVAKFFKKGEIIYLEGKLSTREWQDKEGKSRTSLEVSATDFQFVGGKKNEDSNESNQQSTQSHTRFPSSQAPSNALAASASGGGDVTEEDIPF